MAKDQLKLNYDLEDSVNDFLIYYNRKHSTTGITPYHVMRNVDDEHLISKAKLKTEDKEDSWKLWKRPASKDFKSYLAPRKYWIHCLSTPRGFRKDLQKEKWENKAIVIKIELIIEKFRLSSIKILIPCAK